MLESTDYPELIEPIPLVIEAIDKSQTPFSTGVSGRREAINHIVRSQFTVDAQVVFGNTEQVLKMTQLGPDEQIKGYVVIRMCDLESLNKKISRGDRIIKMKDLTLKTPLFFVHSTGDLSAHFSSFGFTLSRFPFSDREPVG